jgi:hypothetical protein
MYKPLVEENEMAEPMLLVATEEMVYPISLVTYSGEPYQALKMFWFTWKKALQPPIQWAVFSSETWIRTGDTLDETLQAERRDAIVIEKVERGGERYMINWLFHRTNGVVTWEPEPMKMLGEHAEGRIPTLMQKFVS